MRNQVAIRWVRDPWLAALLFVTFFTRALVPSGYMPGPGGLILCLGFAPQVAGLAAHQMLHDMTGMDLSSMDMSGMSMHNHSGTPDDRGKMPGHESMGACPFASAATSLASPHAVPNIVIAHSINISIQLPPQQIIPRGTVVPTSLPRGPPAFLV